MHSFRMHMDVLPKTEQVFGLLTMCQKISKDQSHTEYSLWTQWHKKRCLKKTLLYKNKTTHL